MAALLYFQGRTKLLLRPRFRRRELASVLGRGLLPSDQATAATIACCAHLYAALNQDVDIMIRPRDNTTQVGHISVLAVQS